MSARTAELGRKRKDAEREVERLVTDLKASIEQDREAGEPARQIIRNAQITTATYYKWFPAEKG